MPRKIFPIITFFLLLASSVYAGYFLAERKITREAEKKIVSIEKVDVEESEAVETIEEEKETLSPSTADVSADGSFSFAILGDTQYYKSGTDGGYYAAAASIKNMDPDLGFAVGDLVSSCEEDECEEMLERWKDVLGELAKKTYPAQGNHDRSDKKESDAVWNEVFDHLPENGPRGLSGIVYSIDFQNSHFVVLATDNPKENDISKEQLDWLEADLAKNAESLPAGGQENIFVFFHEPAYPTNSKIGESLDENPENRDRLWSILKKYKTRAVFSGHEHIQSRRNVDGLYQFGFGNTEAFNHDEPKPGTTEYFHVGRGFGLVEVLGQEVTVKTYSVGGELLDTFNLPKD